MQQDNKYSTNFQELRKLKVVPSFIDRILGRSSKSKPIKVKIYSSYASPSIQIDAPSPQEIAVVKFQEMLENANLLESLKKHQRYVILNPEKNKIFQDCLLSYLLAQGQTSKKPQYLTKSGIRVRTKVEKICADFYTELGLPFVYEPIIVFFGYKRNFFKMPDFYFPNFDLIHEHFGYSDNSQYAESMNKKKSIYDSFMLNWFYTKLEDEPAIENALAMKLKSKIMK